MSDEFKENSQAVQIHLSIIQSIIQRMALNSSSCKTWCITIVSAVLVVVADKGKPNYTFIALIPILLFFALDAYYLALEKLFRNSYNDFVEKLHRSTLSICDFFVVNPMGNFARTMFASLLSFATWPFYFVLLLMVLVARCLLT
ncbi:hypothetical protein [Syntrophothermus lipocalidus]|uniref:Uncharacterized protein n=1 Tax=Syntrophothermus lipocalidus (strain DSM 12680 / TGB-C1) TaxID=643648 RepID=D7CIL3_SYNLT|nr:hypothetical protein [Syntrophothermus lipocalidus]ADI00878.1 conserved hypothetical protein [Syntrophothermus lipocalidus DSM 12680]